MVVNSLRKSEQLQVVQLGPQYPPRRPGGATYPSVTKSLTNVDAYPKSDVISSLHAASTCALKCTSTYILAHEYACLYAKTFARAYKDM